MSYRLGRAVGPYLGWFAGYAKAQWDLVHIRGVWRSFWSGVHQELATR